MDDLLGRVRRKMKVLVKGMDEDMVKGMDDTG